MTSLPKIAIIGTVGVPAQYGGFETLAEELVRAAATRGMANAITVYCSAPQTPAPRPDAFLGARLSYVPLRANGVQSVLYDAMSLRRAVQDAADTILLLGVSGAVALPRLRRKSRARLIVHPDGIEWQRAKWSGPARRFLQWSERVAATHADQVIADNPAIAAHLRDSYGVSPVEIAYGGDQALRQPPADLSDLRLPEGYALSIARIEPENHTRMILDAFAATPDQPLVMVGNWAVSRDARALRAQFSEAAHLHLLDPIHDQARLRALRQGSAVYIHGHSAGGTNPTLVEAMHAGRPIAAFDCAFNRETTAQAAAYFSDVEDLRGLVARLVSASGAAQGIRLGAIARRHYRWDDIAGQYMDLLGLTSPAPEASPPAQGPL